jgi:hypothetical protein
MAEHQLRCALRDFMQWNEDMVQTAVDSIRHSALRNSIAGIDNIIDNHMGGDILCRAAVEAYAAEVMAPAAVGARPRTSAGTPPHLPEATGRISTPVSRRTLPGSMPPPTAGHRQKEERIGTEPPTRAPRGGQRSRPVTAMPRVDAHPPSYTNRQRPSRRAAPFVPFAHAAMAALTKSVFNCMECGKVYDCRHVGRTGLDLMNQRGACLFCGHTIPVAMSACFAMANNASPRACSDEAVPGDPPEAEAAYAAAEAAAQKAREFKDRMVEFDRTAAKRTTVIDDQGDYYAIESNAWLSPEERSEMKARVALEELALEERKKRLVVTIDLLGRNVIMEDPTKEHSGVTFERVHASATAAAAATRAARPQGGGSGADAADAAAAQLLCLQNLRIKPTVLNGLAAPVFLPDKANAVHVRRAEARSQSGRGRGGKLHRATRHGAWANRPRPAPAGDMFDQFAEDVQVLYEQTLDAEAAADVQLGGEGLGADKAWQREAAPAQRVDCS